MDIPWLPATVVAAAALFAFLLWGWMRSRKADAEAEPNTPAYDPAGGMHTPPPGPQP